MRVSTRKDDPGYANWQLFRGGRVLLDGVEQENCLMADEEERVVIVACLDCNGRVQCDPWSRQIKTITLSGRVEIIPTPEKAALFAEMNGGPRGADGHRGVIGIAGPGSIAGHEWAALLPIPPGLVTLEVQIVNVGAPLQPTACIDPNAEMQQRDADGALDHAIKQLAGSGVRKMDPAKARQIDEALGLSQRPRDPGQGLDVVAPMDHRLGRFNC